MADESTSTDRHERVMTWPRSLLAALTGVGQIMFQDCALTGLFFLIGLAVVSPIMAAGAAAGAIVGTVTASLLKYDAGEIRDGLYGYNASLVGTALLALHRPGPITFLLGFAGSVASTLLTHVMRRHLPVPAYTAPFVVTTWLAHYVALTFNDPGVVNSTALVPSKTLAIEAAVVRGVSEVMFQTNLLTGVLFIVGILLCSWKGAAWAVVGSLLGLLMGMENKDSDQDLALGIYGYNAALTAMALALYRRSVLLPIVGAVLSVPITEKFPLIGLATLTAPFVLSSWVVISLDQFDAALDRTRPHATG